MYPTLLDFGTFEIGGFHLRLAVHSYGTFLGLAILTVALLLGSEFERKKINPEIVSSLMLAAIVGGIVGAKLYFVIERGSFNVNTIFSGAGLVWYGGLLGGTAGVLAVIRRARCPLLPTIDAIGPLLLLGYGVARIGCFLAGDGDYGPPSDLPWAMAFPDGVIPTVERVHPTPLYESGMSLIAFGLLWPVRRAKESMPGWLFGGYLVLSGLERIVAEFWRRSDPCCLGLTMAQIISFALVILGVFLVVRASRVSHQEVVA
jgi:phosphatidylglycerol:prolipoprotein diacylglycerol transferase